MGKKKTLVSIDSPEFRLFFTMIASFIIMSIVGGEKFVSFSNIKSMATQFPEVGVLAIAVSLAMMLGGINLSVVGIANLSGILCSLTVIHTMDHIGIWPAIILGFIVAVLVGAACGLLNGLLIAEIGIPAMLATLGTQEIFVGLGIGITKGAAVFGTPPEFALLGGNILGIPGPLIIFIIVVFVSFYVLSKRKYGMELKLTGTSPLAASFSGISVRKITIKAHIYGGILSAIAGIIIATRANSAKASYGTSYILQCLLIAVLGGVSPSGGEGKISGIVMAVLTLQILSSGFNLLRVDSYFKTFIWGAVLIFSLIINYYADKHKEKKFIKKFIKSTNE